MLRVSKSLLYAEIRADRIPHRRVSERRVVIPRRELEDYVARRRCSVEEAASMSAEHGDQYR